MYLKFHIFYLFYFKSMDEWGDHDRVNLLSEVIKSSDPKQINFFAQCLIQRLVVYIIYILQYYFWKICVAYSRLYMSVMFKFCSLG